MYDSVTTLLISRDASQFSFLSAGQVLKSLRHSSLCPVLDVQRGKGDRLVVASAYHAGASLSQRQDRNDPSLLLRVATQILEGLDYLDAHGIVHTCLEPDNILVTTDVRAKMVDYGLGHMTNYGMHVAFPVFVNPRTTAPEVYAFTEDLPQNRFDKGGGGGGDDAQVFDDDLEQDSIVSIKAAPPPPPYATAKAPIWSLGMTLLWQVMGVDKLWPGLNTAQTIRKILTVANCGIGSGSLADRIAKEHDCAPLQGAPTLKKLIDECLVVNPKERKSARELLSHVLESTVTPHYEKAFVFPTVKLRCAEVNDESLSKLKDEGFSEEDQDPLSALDIREVFYLWQLAGGSGDPAQAELRRHGLVVNMPAGE